MGLRHSNFYRVTPRAKSLLWCFLIFFSLLFIQSQYSIDNRSSDSASEEPFDIGKLLRTEIAKTLKDPSYEPGPLASKKIKHGDDYSTKSDHPVFVVEPMMTECENIGFAAYFLMTLDLLGQSFLSGATPTVKWKHCRSVCSKDKEYNSWKWYFEPVNPGIENTGAKQVICLWSSISQLVVPQNQKRFLQINNTLVQPEVLLSSSFRRRKNVPSFFKGGVITPELRLWANSLIKKYVKVNNEIQVTVDEFYRDQMKGHHLLGVHIRGTDHGSETDGSVLPLLSNRIRHAEEIFSRLPSPKKIFIASDNEEAVEKFIAHFGKKSVVFTRAKRSVAYEGEPVHLSGYDPYSLGAQVLMDILLLAKCEHFAHTESSVAAIATYFNVDLQTHFYEGQDENSNDAKSTLVHEGDEHTSQAWPEEEERQIIASLVGCIKENAEYSVCPNIATGNIMTRKEVFQLLANENNIIEDL